jgi:hypothetical protein
MTITEVIVPAPPTRDAGPKTSRGAAAPPVDPPVDRVVLDSTVEPTPVATRLAHVGALSKEGEESPDGRAWDELERSLLRMEFEAIIAAAYPAVGERPRPVPPPRRVGTVVSSARPVDRLVSTGGGRRLGRPWPGAAAGIGPRERSPPTGPQPGPRAREGSV